jgi:hypothetical protein
MHVAAEDGDVPRTQQPFISQDSTANTVPWQLSADEQLPTMVPLNFP